MPRTPGRRPFYDAAAISSSRSSARRTRSASPTSCSSTCASRRPSPSRRGVQLNLFLDVQNVTNRANPEEIVYNYDFTAPRLHHRAADAGGARREGAVVMRALLVAVVAAAWRGCKPDFGTPASLVTERRILAVRARAGGGAPDGSRRASPRWWSRPTAPTRRRRSTGRCCVTPKPLDENNVVSSACLADDRRHAGRARRRRRRARRCRPTPVRCSGPIRRRRSRGSRRCARAIPTSPAATTSRCGCVDGAVTGFALERVTCDLAQAGADLAVQYGMSYHANDNPTLQPLTATADGASVALDRAARRRRGRLHRRLAGRRRRELPRLRRRCRSALVDPSRGDARLLVRHRRQLRARTHRARRRRDG